MQGVTVYREAEREFSIGERLQFRAPYQPARVANGELGTLEKIEKGTLTVTLDSGRNVSFPVERNRHIDYGYAVTSHSSQGQTVSRVLVNADTREPDKLLNQRMAYVAASRATPDARIYTDSDERLSAALARQVDKSTALKAKRESHETKVRSVAGLTPIEPTPLLNYGRHRPNGRRGRSGRRRSERRSRLSQSRPGGPLSCPLSRGSCRSSPENSRRISRRVNLYPCRPRRRRSLTRSLLR